MRLTSRIASLMALFTLVVLCAASHPSVSCGSAHLPFACTVSK
ncbi:MAG TPA: hypothetical protein VNT30_17150 [Stellaceae bacterium]|nr:hypothetical protein [Stellaceae bacterium]